MRSSTLVLLVLSPFGVIAQTKLVSKDATCGGSKGYTCLGSAWGDCCSQYGWCGSTTAYCGTNTCQKGFGKCNTAGSSSTTLQSSIRSSSRVQSSTTPRASSSSTVASTASSSTTPQPTNCVSVPACESFTGSPARSVCSDTNNKCSSGYQVKCGLQPAQGSSTVLTSGPQQPDDAGVACAASCTSDAACVGFTYSQRISAARWLCTTYSKITLETNTFSGRVQLKVCPN